jgi:CheY-like chemotaxis protein
MAPSLRPALLLLDLRLPDGFGTMLLHELRQLGNCEKVPAVAVTAEPGFDAAGSGFDEVWSKPMNLRTVLERIDYWLGAAPAPGTPVN